METTMKAEVENANKTQAVMAEGVHRLPGLQASNKSAKMVAREQGAGVRAYAASAAMTPPKNKARMVSSQ